MNCISVWGLDVSKDNVCAHKLSCFPEIGVNNTWQQFRYLKAVEFNQFFPRYFLYPKKDQRTIREWIELLTPGDVVVMEPTGVHAAYLWARAANLYGCKVVWVGHAQLSQYRSGKDLPEKSDAADALCLACYYLDPEHQLPSNPEVPDPRWFLSFDIDKTVYPLAQATAYIRHINRAKSPNENYLKQLLSWQFPEAAFRRSQHNPMGVRPLMAWLSGADDLQTKWGKTIYDQLWEGSIANELGTEPDWYARMLASWLMDCDLAEQKLEDQILSHLACPEFEPYLKIFNSFGMGLREYVPLLIAIYPFENFLLNGKRHKINGIDLSLRAFKHRVGQGGFFRVSGDAGKYAKGGSSNCRQALWTWIYRRICPEKTRPQSGLGKVVGDYYAELEQKFSTDTQARLKAIAEFQEREAKRDKNKGGKRSRGRMTGQAVITGLLVAKTQSRVANMLYRELCKVFITPE